MGLGFDNIPDDALGILATDNNNPLERLNTDVRDYLFNITSKNNELLSLHQSYDTAPHTVNSYLGAIVSNDRSEIYWVNRTNPLP